MAKVVKCRSNLVMYPKQREIADAIISDDAMYHIVNASRQSGKSTMAEQLLLSFALNNKNWHCMFVSMTNGQMDKVWTDVCRVLETSGLVVDKDSQFCNITLCNGSIMWFRSYERADRIRGYDNDLLMVDEAAFLKDNDWSSVFRPTLTTRGKKCVLLSTSKGYNFFAEMAHSAIDGDPRYRYYKWNWRDNPFANVEEVEDARKKMPPKIFAAEYENEFIDDGMSVFDNVANCTRNNAEPIPRKPGMRYYAGIDVGRQDDYTVLTIIDQDGEVALIKRWNQQAWQVIADNVVATMRPYDPTTYIEVNGVGDVFFDIMSDRCRRTGLANLRTLHPWNTTNQSKTDIIEALIYSFNANEVSIPNDDELRLELNCYEVSYSKNSHAVIYNGRSGIHDDMVMSLAIANYVRRTKANYGKYNLI